LDGVELPGKITGALRAGQRLRIETPGGGGFGPARGAARTGASERERGSTAQPKPQSAGEVYGESWVDHS
jgi:N-methylhydantoinase B/oxoprolinase/acetone carboxylase alpha subunit